MPSPAQVLRIWAYRSPSAPVTENWVAPRSPAALPDDLTLLVEQGVVPPAELDPDLADRVAVRIGQRREPVVLAVLPDQREHRLAVRRPHGQHPGARHQADHGLQHTPALGLGGDGEQVLVGVEDLVSGTAGEDLTGLPDAQFPKGEGVCHAIECTAANTAR